MNADDLIKTRLTATERIFRVCIHWNPGLVVWQTDGDSRAIVTEIREPGAVGSVFGAGQTVKESVPDFWDRLTTLPKGQSIRVTHGFSRKEWYEYRWNGEECVEVERSD